MHSGGWLTSSPRPWGCFRHQRDHRDHHWVVPTPVGVFPMGSTIPTPRHGRPHARGGVSLASTLCRLLFLSSPRPWGCFWRHVLHLQRCAVVPTPVGVFLRRGGSSRFGGGRPHARGGVSVGRIAGLGRLASSPRPWGCFFLGGRLVSLGAVVPTPVGVFLDPGKAGGIAYSRPHARGGVSADGPPQRPAPRSSPRPWGCFPAGPGLSGAARVVPTPVGVFPFRLYRGSCHCRRPHARGGVSATAAALSLAVPSSPRPWECFSPRPTCGVPISVVPTPVGVFLPSRWRAAPSSGRPHARGGVSADYWQRALSMTSSPRPWGCFRAPRGASRYGVVVPTPVGVFPGVPRQALPRRRRPHARGGVSGSGSASSALMRSSPRPWGCF